MTITSSTVRKAKLAVNPAACIDVRAESSVCGKCVSVCPEECLKISGRAISVDSISCVECGLCVSVCPSSAISLTRYSDGRIGGTLHEEMNKSTDVTLYCAQTSPVARDGEQIAPIPCLAILGSETLVDFMLSGAQSVNLNGSCVKCAILSGEAEIAKAVSMANYIIEKLGKTPRVNFVPNAVKEKKSKESAEASSRRGFLTSMARMAAKQAVSKVKIFNVSEAQNGWLAPVGLPMRKRILNRNIKQNIAGEMKFGENESPLRMIEVSEQCSLCNACASYCPTGALARRDYPDMVTLEFTPSLCVKCNGCSKLCPDGAISYASEFTAIDALMEKAELKVQKGKAECPSCQKPYVPVNAEQSVCKACMKVDKFHKHLFSMYMSERRSHES